MNHGEQFEELVRIVEKLRGPDGCPWDKEQTHASLLPFFLEEAYEVIETVDEENWKTLSEELGDILLHAVFQTSIGEENGEFTMKETLKGINEKLVSRHPHVFGDKQADNAFHAKQNWEAAKTEGERSRIPIRRSSEDTSRTDPRSTAAAKSSLCGLRLGGRGPCLG